MGRPSKCTPDRIESALDALRKGNTRATAAAAAGVAPSRFREWMAERPELREAVELAEKAAELAFVAAVRDAISGPKGDWRAAAWWLERRRGSEWRQVSAVEVSGPEGGPVETHDVVEWRPDAAWMRDYARVAAEVGADAGDTEDDPDHEVQPA